MRSVSNAGVIRSSQQTMLINHYGLNVMDPQARAFLHEQHDGLYFKSGTSEDVEHHGRERDDCVVMPVHLRGRCGAVSARVPTSAALCGSGSAVDVLHDGDEWPCRLDEFREASATHVAGGLGARDVDVTSEDRSK